MYQLKSSKKLSVALTTYLLSTSAIFAGGGSNKDVEWLEMVRKQTPSIQLKSFPRKIRKKPTKAIITECESRKASSKSQ